MGLGTTADTTVMGGCWAEDSQHTQTNGKVGFLTPANPAPLGDHRATIKSVLSIPLSVSVLSVRLYFLSICTFCLSLLSVRLSVCLSHSTHLTHTMHAQTCQHMHVHTHLYAHTEAQKTQKRAYTHKRASIYNKWFNSGLFFNRYSVLNTV